LPSRSLAVVLCLLAACGPGVRLDLSRSDVIPTVYTAELVFDGPLPEAAWMEFESPDGRAFRAPVDLAAGSPYRTALLGMAPVTDYTVRTVLEWDGEEEASDGQTVTTGQIPAELPDIVLGVDGGHTEDFLVTSVLVMPAAPLILDRDGRIVWWYLPEGVEGVGRATLSRARDAMLFNDLNLGGDEDVGLHRVSLDGARETVTPLPFAHHDFVELPDGGIAYLAHDPEVVDGQEVSGDALRERRPDGDIVEIWNAWSGGLPYEPSDLLPAGDWPHANALDYLEDEDAFLVSFLAWDAILRIDRGSGQVDWVLGSDLGDFTLPNGDPDIFENTHQMEMLDDSLLVFVNGDVQGGTSRAIELALDEDAGVATPVWEHWPEPTVQCLTLGDVHRYPTGNTLITWSFAGMIDEVGPGGDVLWSLSTTLGGALGYTTAMESLYPE
jgi:hypothetical protein